jgi:hydrogenase maturation protein HypF
VPLPIVLEQRAAAPVLAMGGDLKSCFCLCQNDRAYLSQYFGDMEHYEVSQVYKKNLVHMQHIFGINPKVIACDLHPNYHTVQLAKDITAKNPELKLVPIQHHHAHVASVMAEYNLPSCIGVAFDGTGYGTDGAVWGGEFLLCSGKIFERRSHLSYVTLCGGDSAAQDAGLTVDCYLNAIGETGSDSRFPVIQAAIRQNIGTWKSSSMGRLFDAVSAVLGIRTANTYEGECAIALENAAADAVQNGVSPTPLQFHIDYGKLDCNVNQAALFHDIWTAVQNGEDRRSLALGFHEAICAMVLEVCSYIRSESGENRVALSGGVFGNLLLTERCTAKLEAAGFEVYINSSVPTNDGGICLGQAYLCSDIQR